MRIIKQPSAMDESRKPCIQGNRTTETHSKESSALPHQSTFYREFLAERDEILRHKWIESEKAGHDVGFERALLDWVRKHRMSWRLSRKDI